MTLKFKMNVNTLMLTGDNILRMLKKNYVIRILIKIN